MRERGTLHKCCIVCKTQGQLKYITLRVYELQSSLYKTHTQTWRWHCADVLSIQLWLNGMMTCWISRYSYLPVLHLSLVSVTVTVHTTHDPQCSSLIFNQPKKAMSLRFTMTCTGYSRRAHIKFKSLGCLLSEWLVGLAPFTWVQSYRPMLAARESLSKYCHLWFNNGATSFKMLSEQGRSLAVFMTLLAVTVGLTLHLILHLLNRCTTLSNRSGNW